GAADFPVNSVVVVRFVEPLMGASVVTGTVRLFQQATEIPGSVRLSNDGLSITFSPAAPLAASALHNLEVTGVKDLAGNRMTALFTSSFTTGNVSDTTAPTVLLTSPQSGADAVPVNAPFTVEFSER